MSLAFDLCNFALAFWPREMSSTGGSNAGKMSYTLHQMWRRARARARLNFINHSRALSVFHLPAASHAGGFAQFRWNLIKIQSRYVRLRRDEKLLFVCVCSPANRRRRPTMGVISPRFVTNQRWTRVKTA